jgi:ornithine cyclodeaminase
MVWGRSRERARQYAQDMGHEEFNVTIADSPADLAHRCNLIVTATISTVPLLRAAHIQPGTHITAIGSDTPAKNELAADILGRADLCIVDSVSQCEERGELHHALKAGTVSRDRAIELGAVIAETAPRRSNDSQITVCDLTGVAVQDIEISKSVLAHLQTATRRIA